MNSRKLLVHVTPNARRRIFLAARALLGTVALLLYTSAAVYARPAAALTTLPQSVPSWLGQAHTLGQHTSTDQLTIGVVLETSNQQAQQSLLSALYNPQSASYHHWLASGAFDARFAPSSSTVAAVQQYLKNAGLHVAGFPSATLLLATGTTSQIEAAFHTSINNYRTADGKTYFANANAIQLPASLGASVAGVLGLNSRELQVSDDQPAQTSSSKPQLSAPYGAGPYGRGLTPSQLAGIYDTASVYSKLHDNGKGQTLGIFELSGYTHSDIKYYEKYFGLPNVPVVDKNVLGGPIAEDGSVDYGAAEVELDIELQIATAPGAKKILVYNAPNTELGVIGEYLKIAEDNQADSISSSWGLCEYYTDSTTRIEELQAFTQMALQGQSIFVASGDNGTYDCGAGSGLSGSAALQVEDPSANPFATSVGGTSFRLPDKGANLYNPGSNEHPTYPGTADEYTWNEGCTSPDVCEGSGGGVSTFWASSDYVYQNGSVVNGVIEPGYSQTGSYCQQTAVNLCREQPDVSLDADPGTGYAIYCTDVGGGCTDPAYSVNDWTRYGGTSCAAPIWAAITALYDARHGRIGLINYSLYGFDSTTGYAHQFHDITLGDNGYYPAGTAYDMSTGLGTPDVYYIVK